MLIGVSTLPDNVAGTVLTGLVISFVGTTVTVLVMVAELSSPSLTCQVIVRSPATGFVLFVLSNVTDSSTASYSAKVALPVKVRTPVPLL